MASDWETRRALSALTNYLDGDGMQSERWDRTIALCIADTRAALRELANCVMELVHDFGLYDRLEALAARLAPQPAPVCASSGAETAGVVAPEPTPPRDDDPEWRDVPVERARACTVRQGDRYVHVSPCWWITADKDWYPGDQTVIFVMRHDHPARKPVAAQAESASTPYTALVTIARAVFAQGGDFERVSSREDDGSIIAYLLGPRDARHYAAFACEANGDIVAMWSDRTPGNTHTETVSDPAASVAKLLAFLRTATPQATAESGEVPPLGMGMCPKHGLPAIPDPSCRHCTPAPLPDFAPSAHTPPDESVGTVDVRGDALVPGDVALGYARPNCEDGWQTWVESHTVVRVTEYSIYFDAGALPTDYTYRVRLQRPPAAVASEPCGSRYRGAVCGRPSGHAAKHVDNDAGAWTDTDVAAYVDELERETARQSDELSALRGDHDANGPPTPPAEAGEIARVERTYLLVRGSRFMVGDDAERRMLANVINHAHRAAVTRATAELRERLRADAQLVADLSNKNRVRAIDAERERDAISATLAATETTLRLTRLREEEAALQSDALSAQLATVTAERDEARTRAERAERVVVRLRAAARDACQAAGLAIAEHCVGQDVDDDCIQTCVECDASGHCDEGGVANSAHADGCTVLALLKALDVLAAASSYGATRPAPVIAAKKGEE